MPVMDLVDLLDAREKNETPKTLDAFCALFEKCVQASTAKGPNSIAKHIDPILCMLVGTQNSALAECSTEADIKRLVAAVDPASCFFQMLLRFSADRPALLEGSSSSLAEHFLSFLVTAASLAHRRDMKQPQNTGRLPEIFYTALFKKLFAFLVPLGSLTGAIYILRLSGIHQRDLLHTGIRLVELLAREIAGKWLGQNTAHALSLLFVEHTGLFFREHFTTAQNTVPSPTQATLAILDAELAPALFLALQKTFQKHALNNTEVDWALQAWAAFLLAPTDRRKHVYHVATHFPFYHTLFYAFLESQIAALLDIGLKTPLSHKNTARIQRVARRVDETL
ncbi:MAG: uncharacterized protein A8A55_1048, partial [Amphiamblys sp. WSBS2006]